MNEMIEPLRPTIPESVYKPVKRCPNCQSVYLTDSQCEACGRSLLYHPIGEAFSAKSLYGFKERYHDSLPLAIQYFTLFENRTNPRAKSYVRQLLKRFDDLILAFGQEGSIAADERRFFYVETMELIDELLRYGVEATVLQQKIEHALLDNGPLLTQELLLYLQESQKENRLPRPWKEVLMSHRLYGMRVEFILKSVLITATVIALAVGYYEIISSQVGR